MAFSAHTNPDQVIEHNSPGDVVQSQAEQLAEMIRSAKHFVAFTGAGISTSAGIPDFRGPNGVWTRRAQGQGAPSGVSTTRAIPTATHMALVALAKSGHLKLLISQNCDGLHRRSGFPPDRLAELHGNSNLEYCENCGRQYLRDFHTRTAMAVHEHETGRACTVCNGRLLDSVVNFGEALPQGPMTSGFQHCRKADVVLCLGSSLTVTPAANMPEEAAERGARLVICNLQKTPLDELSRLRIFARTDDLMLRVCSQLGLQIPAWRLRRRLRVDVADKPEGRPVAVIGCVEEDGTPATVFSRLTVGIGADDSGKMAAEFNRQTCATASEFNVPLPRLPCRVAMVMAFMGHYAEPDYSLTLTLDKPCQYAEQPILLEFDPVEKKWSCSGL